MLLGGAMFYPPPPPPPPMLPIPEDADVANGYDVVQDVAAEVMIVLYHSST